MDPYERSQVADAIKSEKYKPGEYVVKQGEEGDKFYMIEEGELVAEKVIKPGENPTVVFSYKPGMYFGELALLKNCPRQASILCTTDVKLVVLDRASFKRMLGPVEEILSRNQDKYSKYM